VRDVRDVRVRAGAREILGGVLLPGGGESRLAPANRWIGRAGG
jgi:hypothetical protein